MVKKSIKQGYQLVEFLGKEIEIPIDWGKTKHGDICEFVNGYAFSESEFSDSGYQIIRIQNLTGRKNFVYSNVKLPEKQFAVEGDLLFTWSGTFSPFIWHGEKSAFHYHQWKVIPKKFNDKTFFYYHLIQVASTIKQMGQSGLGMFHMTKEGMEKFPIMKPPFSEQQKIAKVLSDTDELIKQLDYLITKKKNIKQGAMQELLTGKKRLEGFDGEWIEDFLGLLLLLLKDGTHNPPKRISKGIPLLASENIHDGEIDFEKSSSYISEQDYKELQKQYHISKMDLLLTIVGTIGRVSLVKQESKFSVQRSVAILRANNRISPQFLYFIIQSYTFQLQLQLNKNATAQSGIYLNSLSKIKLFFPKMVTEQEKIAEILFDMDSEIKELEAKKDKYIMIKNGMMQKLLTGEIRLT